jgi:DNA-binding PadR family transcriptional regulator
MELNATQKAILGFIAARPRSGYEIKQLVDFSTQYFWAASYGRIYPELKRLEKEGLIKGADASQGARNRTVYELTAKGRAVAAEWIAVPPEVYELRDEGLLKLFFAGTLDAARAPEIAREHAARSAAIATELRGLQETMATSKNEAPELTEDAGSDAVLAFGIALNEFVADWFERTALDLEKTKENA